jgi:hypothetical protein
MGFLKLRLTDEEEVRFREAAERSGLKISHFLRRMVERELADAGHGKAADAEAAARLRELELYAYLHRPDVKDRHRREFARSHDGARYAHMRPPEPHRPKGLRFQLSLTVEEVLAVEEHGAILALRPAQFCTVLVRQWLRLRKAPPASTANALALIRGELRRIGVNINQIARTANELARLADRSPRDEGVTSTEDFFQGIAALPGAIQEIIRLVADVDAHLGRERRYWDIRTTDDQEVDLHPSIAGPPADEPI